MEYQSHSASAAGQDDRTLDERIFFEVTEEGGVITARMDRIGKKLTLRYSHNDETSGELLADEALVVSLVGKKEEYDATVLTNKVPDSLEFLLDYLPRCLGCIPHTEENLRFCNAIARYYRMRIN